MTKIKKILIIILSIIAILVLGAYGAYHFYVKPVVLESVAEKAQQVLNDDKVKEEVDKFVNEMLQDGVLQDSDIQGYIEYKQKDEEKKAQQASGNVENDGADKSQSTGSSSSGSTSYGAVGNNGAGQSGAATTEKKADKSKKLIDRVQEAMTADEFAFAMSIYNKLDVSYVTGNMNANREEVKQYVKSTLTSAEISKSLSIYSKYAYLLD